jgi:hypothetical protein
VRLTPSTTLDTSDHQSAKLVYAGRLDPGDDVVETAYNLGPSHAVDAPDGLGDLACLTDLGLDEHLDAT